MELQFKISGSCYPLALMLMMANFLELSKQVMGGRRKMGKERDFWGK